jgi:gluconolactonase
VTTKSDGSIWFSDPPYGIGGNYIGNKAESELPANVYRVGPDGRATVVADDFNRPNGICFSPDESKLYITDSGARPNRVIRVFDVVENGTKLANGRVFIDGQGGNPDGMRCDTDGNLWVGWGIGSTELNGVACFRRRASSSCASDCPKVAPISPSAGSSATACLLLRASRSMRCM